MKIYIRLEGHDFKYEIEDVIRLFFGNGDINIEYRDLGEDNSGFILYSGLERLITADEKHCIKTMLEVNGDIKFIENEIIAISSEEDEHEVKKIKKREIKRQVYRALSRYTAKKMPWGVLTGIRPAKIVHELMNRGLDREQIYSRLTDYYYVSGKKAELLYNIAQKEKPVLDSAGYDKISIYIGIPFCPTRCLYCSFTSNPVKKYAPFVKDYIGALKKEISGVGEILDSKGFTVQSIYIGGGTPTSIDASYLEELLIHIEKVFNMTETKEYTLEAGRPDSIDGKKLEVIKKSKVNRISINPQSMNDEVLRDIGRLHTAKDIVDAFNLARNMGFDNINMDVIAGLPGERLEDFKYTLKRIAELDPESITVHTMAIKRASRLNEDKDSYRLISGNEVAKMVDAAYDFITKNGLEPYYIYRQKNMLGNLENIGYSRPGYECMYNIQIMEEKQTIIALGAGAVTKVVFPENDRIERTFNVKSVEEYVDRIEEMIGRKRSLID
ncbi:MAG: coproporphyrinogen dehydrogenase HemZ [Clostridium sp.]|jgi:oxygen-independent coproporphyrinogen-3 oxidase|nr:coproporphyrinogen dehydrogenase HemZ [Clostridium sp.]